MLSSLRRADACRKHDCIPTILERLFWQISGRSDACRNVRNVAIVPVNAPEAETNWAIDFIADGAAQISHDCKFQMIALQNRMQREYEAIWPDDERPDRPPAVM
jgi:hypothetical protein